MLVKKKAILLALLSACFDGTAIANTALNQKLLEQAQYWLQRGREDNAADAWRKLLKADPANVDAVAGLGLFEAHNGHSAEAKNYLSKLRQLQAAAPQIAELEAAIKSGSSGKTQLAEARQLAQQGKADEAIERYKLAGAPAKLKGDAALEYYQVLSGTLEGYDDARAGLEQLVKDNPANNRYALALAQVYTYRAPSRAEGLRLLAELSKKTEVAKQAEESWRQGLTWLGGKKEDERLLHAYLERHPDDRAIKDRLAEISKQNRVSPPAQRAYSGHAGGDAVAKLARNPMAKSQAAAYRALQKGELAEAETEFESILKTRPEDAAALGGLGLVRMKQELFAIARDLLERAINASPKSGKKQWKQAHESAAYWALVQEANAERDGGRPQQAITLLRKALQINDSEPTGRLLLGDALLATDDPVAAEANYRGVLAEHKHHEQALFSLIGLLRQQKRDKEAEALTAKLSAAQRTALAGGGEYQRVAALREMARQAEAGGDIAGAQMALEDAMLAAPDNVWIRLELARLYQRRDLPGQARSLLSGLLGAEPPMPDALYVSALLSAEQQLWWEGLNTLERIPESARTKDMAVLQKTLWIQVQMERAGVLAQQGRQQQANDILRQAEAAAGNAPEYVSVLAAGYIKNGELGRGLSLLRQALAKTGKPAFGLRLQYADALLRTRQDAELEPLIRQLYAMPNLQPQDLAALYNLRLALALRQAEAAREAGNLAAAYDYIAPLLAEKPDDNRLLLALARMYSSAGDTMQATELFAKVLESEPDNLEAYQAMVYAGIAIKDYAGAETYLVELLNRQPDNPRYIALAGRLARAQGNNAKALELFRQAMALERSQPAAGLGANGLRLVDQQGPASLNKVPANPFAGRSFGTTPASRSQDSGPNLREVTPGGLPRLMPAAPAVPVAPIAPASQAPAFNDAPLAAAAPAPQPAQFAVPVQVYGGATLPASPAPAKSTLSKAPLSVTASLQQEIDAIQDLNKSAVSAGFSARARSGEKGLSQLKDLETPIELQVASLGKGQLGLKLIPVLVDAGTLYLNDTSIAGQYGRNAQLNERAKFDKQPFTTIAAQEGLPNVPALTQQAKGVALSLSYEIASLKIDVGASPVGFAVNNVVGGVRWSEQIDGVTLGAELSRRSVTDSYLSYAGARDSIYGLAWGGVTKSGLHLDASYDGEEGGVYASTGFYSLNGQNVARNSMFELGGGAYWRAYRSSDTTLTTGLNLTSMFYNKNLRYFSYGQGGYFSPKSYVALGVPLELAGRKGRLAYQLGTSIGVQHFSEGSSAYYPNSSADQADLELFAAANPNVNVQTYYPGQTRTGVQFKLLGALEYQLNPQLFIGGRLSVDNSGDFTDGAGALYLRYAFEPQKRAIAFPPVAPKPYYLGN